ncbi:MAG: cobalt-precorrin-6A synthase [Deltaproteobacteria bacterium]|nr:MAG: cobalt-precorrin-6A synthase [Deltaproteobacteria bacterium]
MSGKLRSGFSTGACSAAAAKAAATALCTGSCPEHVDLSFPNGQIHRFLVHSCRKEEGRAFASVIKEAGDDPDITHHAEICASIGKGHIQDEVVCVFDDNVQLIRGSGVGVVTKPGLSVAVGEPAINPVPRKMIYAAIRSVTEDAVNVTISIVNGEILAEKTLNKRLGILGGLSVLGTTGIVRPVSAAAWIATISTCMDVARRAGLTEIVLSTGRTSEKGAQDYLDLPEEAYAMMGDYLAFSLKTAARKGFATIHYAGMWAKLMKAALQIPQTHVRNGALEIAAAAELLNKLGAQPPLTERLKDSNTAREMLGHIQDTGQTFLIEAVCHKAKAYAEEVSGSAVKIYLIDNNAKVIAHA